MPHPDWLRPFAPAFRRAVGERLAARDGTRVACFDADGTLWEEDLGEGFLRWLLAGPLAPLVARQPDLYARYEARVRRSLTAGYGWAVQLMAGLAEADVARWARQLVAAWPGHRPAMRDLACGLAAEGFAVWLVSASNHWVIAAAAERLGLPADRVIAVRVAVERGILTDRLLRPVPCEDGKAKAIRRTIGVRPDLAVGDGLGDLAMLELATLPLVVGSRRRAQAPLLAVARDRGWPVHRFP